jgi:CRISPR-associated exonuclease Cas4
MAKVYPDSDLLHLSGIQHFVFCQRQWALIHIEQQWEDNILTFRGQELHQTTNDPYLTEKRGDVLVTRAMPMVSHSLGLYGVADVIEFHSTAGQGVKLPGRRGVWSPTPIEYKLGRPKPSDCDILQLCAQAMCLEETFDIVLQEGYVFYGRTRRRLEVILDSILKNKTREVCKRMHAAFLSGKTPKAEYTSACEKCSLIEHCLPQLSERRSVEQYLSSALVD